MWASVMATPAMAPIISVTRANYRPRRNTSVRVQATQHYSARRVGTNTTDYLGINSKGKYQLNGGTLNVTGGFSNQGVFDAGGGTLSLSSTNCLVNFSNGILQNVGGVSLNIGANSLLIASTGFNPSIFGSYTCSGLVHTAGTTLSLSPAESFGGIGSVNDPVDCRGAIAAAPGGFINLNNGLVLSGNASVALGNGSLTVNDTTSTIIGGAVSMSRQYVGNAGTGMLTQSAGTNSVSDFLYLGYNSVDCGEYRLSDSGTLSASHYESVGYLGAGIFRQSGGIHTVMGLLVGDLSPSNGSYYLSDGVLSASWEQIGLSGTGVFDQSGGTNTINRALRVGGHSTPGSGTGTYLLKDGTLTALWEVVGSSRSGTFTQSGGTNTISGYGSQLCLGEQEGSTGTYNLSGGILVVPAIVVGRGSATFNFGGGTLQVSTALSTSLPMTLTGIGGNANVDTAGHEVAISGQLSGPGGLNKRGAGTLALLANNTYTGNTIVSEGTLLLDEAGSLMLDVNDATNSLMTVAVDARLDLFGTVRLDVDSITVSSGSWTLIDGSGTTVYEPSFGLAMSGGDSFTQVNDVWTYTTGSQQWTFSEAIGGLSLTSVPEPSTFALLVLGTLSLVAYVWQQRRAE